MTTYGQLLNLQAVLKHLQADLKSLAAGNTHDLEADAVMLQSAVEINAIIRELDQRRRELLREEPQYYQEELIPQPKGGGPNSV